MTAIVFKKAERAKVRLKVLLTGPSGAGKTKGALYLAQGLNAGPVAAIDSENDRMLYYAEEFDFAHLSLADIGPLTPAAYTKAVQAAIDGGFQCVIIDSLHHAWQDVLDRKEAYDSANPKSNGFANWKKFSREWDTFVRFLLTAPIHVIATSRSKQEYQIIDNGDRKRVAKLGMNPTIREGTEYEFALVFDLMLSHVAHCTKDNTGLFGTDPEQTWDLKSKAVATDINNWLSSATAPEVIRQHGEDWSRLPFGKPGGDGVNWKGKLNSELPLDVLQRALEAAEANGRYPEWQKAARIELDQRGALQHA